MSIGNEVIYESVIQKYNKGRKQYEKDQETSKSFDKLYRKCLQDNVKDENENETLCNNLTKCLDETRKESFL